ncbi:EAL domain-containing protein [Solemya elarraichensis gill symbiont]|uniref:Cyclic nucleotide-binding protein n=1 Tax=Solemya elarraichensis gill symbiont TaxID=1918949 RepID=A0A1T2KWN0_9GAMM|nr:EAL domain-containing protein [Solemya elarraichensis gill symbiont]OOZ37259.1 hypothetical protein BOW52_10285 [Solemya elarraichensis gill symbiont]
MDKHRIQVRAGARLFEEGCSGDCAYIIEKGEIVISSCTSNGTEVQLAILGPGNLVGEMAIIDGGPRTATASVVEDAELIVIPPEHFARLIDTADPTVTLLMQVVLHRYRNMKERYALSTNGVSKTEISESTGKVEADLVQQAGLAKERIAREQELRNAIINNELELFYQPITDLRTGRVVSCEGLIRWIDPQQGIIPPNHFIPLAEETGLIELIGYQVFEQAYKAVKEFNNHSEKNIDVSVNLSSRQIETDEQVEKLFEFLAEKQIDLNNFKIEITETLLMSDQERVGEILMRFKEMGAKISLDDFGTGYSSFSYLHLFPIDKIKIDRSFVSSMHKNDKSKAIVRSLCSLSSSLDMKVIAEGVESVQDEEMLNSFDYDYGQGYYYAKPLPKRQFLDFLASRVTADLNASQNDSSSLGSLLTRRVPERQGEIWPLTMPACF